MIIGSALCFIILLLPVELQTIFNDLGANEYKVRKSALHSAKKLSAENKRTLITKLKKSNDPELTETAKELSLLLPEALNRELILKYILEKDYKKIKLALKVNPTIFKSPLIENLNATDIAKMLNLKKFLILFKNSGLKQSDNIPKTMDVLVVETDTWETLAKDFKCSAKLLELVNKNGLKPGAVIKVPRSK